MNPSKTANPTTGVIEAGPINSLTRKTTISGITTSSNKHAIGFSNHKHTPITATHTRPHTLGASASNIATPQPEQNPNRTRVRPGQTRQKPCSSNHVPGGATRYNSRPDQKRS